MNIRRQNEINGLKSGMEGHSCQDDQGSARMI